MKRMAFSWHSNKKKYEIRKYLIPVIYTFKQWNLNQYWANMSLPCSTVKMPAYFWIVFFWTITTAIEVRDRQYIYCEAGLPLCEEEVDEVPDIPGHLHVLGEAKAVLVVHDLPIGPHQGLRVKRGLTCSQGRGTLTLHSCIKNSASWFKSCPTQERKTQGWLQWKKLQIIKTIMNKEKMESFIFFVYLFWSLYSAVLICVWNYVNHSAIKNKSHPVVLNQTQMFQSGETEGEKVQIWPKVMQWR